MIGWEGRRQGSSVEPNCVILLFTRYRVTAFENLSDTSDFTQCVSLSVATSIDAIIADDVWYELIEVYANTTTLTIEFSTINNSDRFSKEVASSGIRTHNSNHPWLEVWRLTNVAIQICAQWEIFQMNYTVRLHWFQSKKWSDTWKKIQSADPIQHMSSPHWLGIRLQMSDGCSCEFKSHWRQLF